MMTMLTPRVRTSVDDGRSPNLTCATDAGKLFVHNPHERNDAGSGARVQFLNVNKQVSFAQRGKGRDWG